MGFKKRRLYISADIPFCPSSAAASAVSGYIPPVHTSSTSLCSAVTVNTPRPVSIGSKNAGHSAAHVFLGYRIATGASNCNAHSNIARISAAEAGASTVILGILRKKQMS